MRTFSESAAAGVPDPEYPQSPRLNVGEIVGLPIIIIRANIGTTKFGEAAFLTVYLPAEAEHTEYTIIFGERSKAFSQVAAIQKQTQFPILCCVKPWNKSFELADAPVMNDELAVEERYIGNKARRLAAELAAESKQAPVEGTF